MSTTYLTNYGAASILRKMCVLICHDGFNVPTPRSPKSQGLRVRNSLFPSGPILSLVTNAVTPVDHQA